MYINHNQMAQGVSNNLTDHYANLTTSTQRLSSGLRVNSAADDAAGLAIRELMRADISALQQGVRNANDGISLIQTADGALGIIDEKLIRMKELAEQAATGTYDSTQRLMIESEYQAMASEITRIAKATDFNGIKLLDGSLEGTHDGSGMKSTGELKVHFGSGNNSAEDYYYIGIGEMTAAALGVGNASTFGDVIDRAVDAFSKQYEDSVKASSLSDADKGLAMSQLGVVAGNYRAAIENAIKPENAHKYWAPDTAADEPGFLEGGKEIWDEKAGNTTVVEDYLSVAKRDPETYANGKINALTIQDLDPDNKLGNIDWTKIADAADTTEKTKLADLVNKTFTPALKKQVEAIASEAGYAGTDLANITNATLTAFTAAATNTAASIGAADWLDGAKTAFTGAVTAADKVAAKTNAINNFYGDLREGDKQKLQYAFGQAAMYNLANLDPADEKAAATATATFGIGVVGTDFGLTGSDTANSEQNKILKAALAAGFDKVKDMDAAGFTIETQEDAQQALKALDNAIIEKDKTRAHLGALQNRLENTVSNLTTQSENLQAAESRISDVDVATEMTNFVRNQILTQSAVAMLGQANSMPQMAMQLIR